MNFAEFGALVPCSLSSLSDVMWGVGVEVGWGAGCRGEVGCGCRGGVGCRV